MAVSGLPLGDTAVFSIGAFGYNGGYPNTPTIWKSGGYWELSATGNAQLKWGTCESNRLPGAAQRMVTLNGMSSGLELEPIGPYPYQNPSNDPPAQGVVVNVDPARTDDPSVAELAHASFAGACAMGADGELLAMTCARQNKVYYHRLTQAGGVFSTAEVLEGAQEPIAVGRSRAAGASVQVGVALRDGANNLWFFVRDGAGAPVLAPAVIGGGDGIRSAWVLHDGIDFVVVWLAKTGGFEQAYAQRVTCE